MPIGKPAHLGTSLMLEPGIYFDIDEKRYHSDDLCEQPSLSASLVQVLDESTPLHAWTQHPRLNPACEPDSNADMDRGSVAHVITLGRGKLIDVIEADSWRTKDAQTKRDLSRKAGRIPILAKDKMDAIRMSNAARAQLDAIPDCKHVFQEGHGAAEVVLVAKDPSTGIYMRSMVDWLANDGDAWDLKTGRSSANPLAAGRRAADAGWDIKAAFYLRMLRMLDIDCRHFRFIGQENFPPYALSVVELDAEAISIGNRKVERAIHTYAHCLKTGVWPAYPPMVHRIELPSYQLARAEEREVFARMTEEDVKRSVEAQKP